MSAHPIDSAPPVGGAARSGSPSLALVLGTAGHVDHGKTTLVHALTGVDTDRLPVEKARGITTELGFAPLAIGDRKIAVVDVPGHERFVKAMVAGATGMDLVCLVVAADEGVMPQTREHIEICELLAVRAGVIALTKCDAADGELAAMAEADVRAAVAGTSLAAAPIVRVSARTGAGMDALRAAIEAAIAKLPPREAHGVFRAPIDRVFTVRGFGTVATATALGGEVAVGDELHVVPSGRVTRVRGIEVHGEPAERAVAGHRVALNLGGIAVDELARGDVLVHAGEVAASHILDVELHYSASAPAPLPARSKLLLHHGTTHVLATVALVGTGTGAGAAGARVLAPGATGFAQIRLDRSAPLAALPGDRFIVRGFSATTAGTTVGGGRIIRVLAPKARAKSAHADVVAQLARAQLAPRIALEARSAAAAGLAIDALVQRIGASAGALAPPLAQLVASGELMAAGERYLHAATVAELEAKLLAQVAAAPDGVAREAARTQLPAALSPRGFDAIVAGLAQRGAIAAGADRLAKPTAAAMQLSPLELRLLERLRAAGVSPPRPAELAVELALAPTAAKAALDRLIAAKLVARIKPDLVLAVEVVDRLRADLLAHLAVHATIDAPQWKELTGASRKYSIPLAEYFDAEKVTLRIGDLRRKR